MNTIIRWGIALVLCCVSGINLFSQVKKLEEMEDYRQFQYYYELANKNNNEQDYTAGLLNVEKVWDFISRLEDMQKAWEEENRAKVEDLERNLEDIGREVENAAKETRLALFMDAAAQAEEEALRAQEEAEREKAAQAQALARAEEASRRAEEAAKRFAEARLALQAVQREEKEYLTLAESGMQEIERKTALAAEAESEAEKQKRLAQENLASKQRIETALIRTLHSEEANVDQSKREFEIQSAEAARVIEQARHQAQLLSNQLHAKDALERTLRGQTELQAGAPSENRILPEMDALPPAPDDVQSQEISRLAPAPWNGVYNDPAAADDEDQTRMTVVQNEEQAAEVQDDAPALKPDVYPQPVAAVPAQTPRIAEAQGDAPAFKPDIYPQPVAAVPAQIPRIAEAQGETSVPKPDVYNQPIAAAPVQDKGQTAEDRSQYQAVIPPPQSEASVLPLAIRNIEGFSGSENRGRTGISAPVTPIPARPPNEPVKTQLQLAAKYVVKRGDTLWKIAALEFIYNDGSKAGSIFNVNRDILSNPNLIEPGMVLTIPSIAGEERSGTR
jgi:nucleoid-associated protein YgaU